MKNVEQNRTLLRSLYVTYWDFLNSRLDYTDMLILLITGLQKIFSRVYPGYEPAFRLDGTHFLKSSGDAVHKYELEDMLFCGCEDEFGEFLLNPLYSLWDSSHLYVSSIDINDIVLFFQECNTLNSLKDIFIKEGCLKNFSRFLCEFAVFFSVSRAKIKKGLLHFLEEKCSFVKNPDCCKLLCERIFAYFEEHEESVRHLNFNECPTDYNSKEYTIAKQMFHLLLGKETAFEVYSKIFYQEFHQIPWFCTDTDMGVDYEYNIRVLSSKKWYRYANLPEEFKANHPLICEELDLYRHYIMNCFDPSSSSINCFDGIWYDSRALNISIVTGSERSCSVEFGLDKIYLSFCVAAALAEPLLDQLLQLYLEQNS